MATERDPLTAGRSRPVPWRNPRVRSFVYQLLVLAAVVAVLAYAIGNAVDNLRDQGIASGFGFLDRAAGFGIQLSLIPYSELSPNIHVFWVGLLNTILVAVLGIVLATILGFAIGLARLSPNWLLARLATVYIESIRNVPVLLQILFWYIAVLQTLPLPRDSLVLGDLFYLNNRGFFAPQPIFGDGVAWLWLALAVAVVGTIGLTRWARGRRLATGRRFPTVAVGLGLLIGLPAVAVLAVGIPLSFEHPELGRFRLEGGLVVIPELVALVTALSIYTAAFIAEIVRAGVLAVHRGQIEAAEALGLKPRQTLRLVIVPLAMRVIIPPLTSQYLNLAKNSSLAVAIGYPDLVNVFAGTVLNQTGQAVEVIAMTMLVYLSLSLAISLLMNAYNRRMALVER